MIWILSLTLLRYLPCQTNQSNYVLYILSSQNPWSLLHSSIYLWHLKAKIYDSKWVDTEILPKINLKLIWSSLFRWHIWQILSDPVKSLDKASKISLEDPFHTPLYLKHLSGFGVVLSYSNQKRLLSGPTKHHVVSWLESMISTLVINWKMK